MSEQNSHFVIPKNVIIIGAGIVGLGIAWRLAQRGVKVTVFDKGGAGAGASHAAAGMLAACVEAEPGEEALVALGRVSQAQWPDFAAELERVSGMSVDLRREGILMIALTADDQARLHHHLEFQRRLELRWSGSTRLSCGGGSLIWDRRSPARSTARRTIKSTTANLSRRCAWRPRQQALSYANSTVCAAS